MRNKFYLGLLVGTVCSLLILGLSFVRGSNKQTVYSRDEARASVYSRDVRTEASEQTIKLQLLQVALKEERNRLSKELNLLKQKLGQMDCEAKVDLETSSAGGWCKNSSTEDGGQHMTDMYLVAALSQFLNGKRVGSFGDGPGAYKRELTKLGEVRSYDAYDGAPYCEETSGGLVKFMDLTVPQYGVPLYDWIISIEVAEHIPREFEAIYIDNIVRHAKEGLIMSWAVPGQGGLAHINLRPLAYVIDLMNSHGFSHDKEASEKIKASSSFQWLRDNVNVFRRVVNSTDMDFQAKWYT